MDGTIKMDGYFFYWFELPFEESLMIKCDDPKHSISTKKYVDNYAVVTGIFNYVIEDNTGTASIELLYTG